MNNKRKNAFSNMFTNSLERKKRVFILHVRWLLISELYCTCLFVWSINTYLFLFLQLCLGNFSICFLCCSSHDSDISPYVFLSFLHIMQSSCQVLHLCSKLLSYMWAENKQTLWDVTLSINWKQSSNRGTIKCDQTPHGLAELSKLSIDERTIGSYSKKRVCAYSTSEDLANFTVDLLVIKKSRN